MFGEGKEGRASFLVHTLSSTDPMGTLGSCIQSRRGEQLYWEWVHPGLASGYEKCTNSIAGVIQKKRRVLQYVSKACVCVLAICVKRRCLS